MPAPFTTPVAKSTPFDNTTNGFTAQDVQAAIEEINNAFNKHPNQIVYVATNGNDSTGDGTYHNPFLTIKHAASTITDSSTNKRYSIKVAPGNYSEDNPITIPAYTMLEGEGKGVVKIIGQNDDKILISSFLSRFQNFLLIGNGTSNEIGIYCGENNGQTIMWDIAFIDTYIGLHIDNATAWVLAYNLELLTANHIMNTGILMTGGNCQITTLSNVTQSASAIQYGVRAVGSNSIFNLSGCNFNSSNISIGLHASEGAILTSGTVKISQAAMGMQVLSGARMYTAAYSVSYGTVGASIDGAGTEFAGHSGHILACTIGCDVNNGALCRVGSTVIYCGIAARLNNASVIEASGVDVHNSTLNIDMVDSASNIYMSGGDVNKDKIRYQNGIAENSSSVACFISRKPGDEGYCVFGELAVGRPDLGFESCFGEGDSYTLGMTVLTSDNTATNTTDGGNFIDKTAEATEIDTNYFGFQGSTANHCIYITTDIQNTSWGSLDYSRLTGIKVNQITAAVEVTPKSLAIEYWDGSEWVEGRTMATESNKYYRYANNIMIRANSSEHIRFGRDLLNGTVKKTINGKERHWVRLRIKNNLTVAPTFNQWKISNNRTEINSDGTLTFHGTSRYVEALSFSSSSFGETGGVTDSKIQIGSGSIPYAWYHTLKNSRLNGNGDAVYSVFSLPEGICTSCPLNIRIQYIVLESGPSSDGNIIVSVNLKHASGVKIADPAGGIVPIIRTNANTPQLNSDGTQVMEVSIPLSDSNIIERISTPDIDITDYYEDDIVFVRIEYDDNGNANKSIAVVGIEVEGVKWTLGARL